MAKYRAVHEIRVFESPRDRNELERALMVFARTTSPLLRTHTNQIQTKFDRPNNPHGTFFFVGLYQDHHIVGFAMFGYYPRCRVVAIDHVAIEEGYRKHGSFYVFASLLQRCIEERCPNYDFAVAEIAVDREFEKDEISGRALIRLLRQIGFGQAQVRYELANAEPRDYRKNYRAALMMRGTQKITQLRCETFLDVYEAILFEHYLPWYKDFFGEFTSKYEAYLRGLHKDMKAQLQSMPTIIINGADHDELSPKPPPSRRFLGLPISSIGHVVGFALVLIPSTAAAWLLGLKETSLLLFPLVIALVYLGLMAQGSVRSMRVFERLGSLITKIFSGK